MSRGRRLSGTRRGIAIAALIVCLLGAGILGCLAWRERQERSAGAQFYAETAKYLTNDDGAVSSKGAESMSETDDSQSSAPDNERINFSLLQQEYADVVGWIQLEDSVINYPVVQGKDNAYYLKHLPDGTANASGSIMLDQANSANFSDMVSILHGHHMRDGSMFGSLENYVDAAYYRAHPIINLYTPEETYAVEIFAACTVDGNAFDYATSFANEDAFYAFVKDVRTATPYKTEVEVKYGDHLLLLSTCAYTYEDARFVVVGVLTGK